LKGRKSVQVITTVFKASIRPAFGDRRPASLTTLDFERYREEREKDVDPVTVNRDLAYLRAALNNGMLRQTPRKVESVPYMPMADESHNVRTGFVEVPGYQEILQQVARHAQTPVRVRLSRVHPQRRVEEHRVVPGRFR
jgi:hypothetical protein